MSTPATPEIETILKSFSKLNSPDRCSLDSEMEYTCDSLSTLSCAPGTFDDGTGKVLGKDEYTAKITPMKATVKENYQKAILKMLRDPDPKYALVRELAIKATLQEKTPGCTSSESPETKACEERVASLLANHQTKHEFTNPAAGMGQAEEKTDEKPKKVEFDYATYSALSGNRAYTDALSKVHEKNLDLMTERQLAEQVRKKVFPRVKDLLIQKVNAYVTDKKVREAMVRKIQNITFAGTDCTEVGGTSLHGLSVKNAFYNPGSQAFTFCNGFLMKNSSEFAIAMVITHELSHSIDPCSIARPQGAAPITYETKGKTWKELEAQYPIPEVISCLRTKESVGAKFGQMADEDHSYLDSNPFCNHDQITEGFSDWMGAEVLPEYVSQYLSKLTPDQKLIGYSNVFRNRCGVPSTNENDVHPENEDRNDRILMANPASRKILGCGDSKVGIHYCKVGEPFEGTLPDPVAASTPGESPWKVMPGILKRKKGAHP